MATKGDVISRLRGVVKGAKADAFLTDRFIYSLFLKYAKLYVARMDDNNKLGMYNGLFESLPCLELEEIDKIAACCGGIKTGCTFMRTRNKLPTIIQGSQGPLIRKMTSIDGSVEIYRTQPSIYVQMSNSTTFKYNKNKYYWIVDGHAVFPNIIWEAVSAEVLPEESIQAFKCDGDPCLPAQDSQINVPDRLLAEIEQNVKADLLGTIQIPPEADADNKSQLKD